MPDQDNRNAKNISLGNTPESFTFRSADLRLSFNEEAQTYELVTKNLRMSFDTDGNVDLSTKGNIEAETRAGKSVNAYSTGIGDNTAPPSQQHK